MDPDIIPNNGYNSCNFTTLTLVILMVLIRELINVEDELATIDNEVYDNKSFQKQFQLISEAIQAELADNVCCQLDALSVINETLTEIHVQQNSTVVLGLIGPPGVGKTFTANIIKRHFQQQQQLLPGTVVTELFGSSGLDALRRRDTVLRRTATAQFQYNLIILDDLSSVSGDCDALLSVIARHSHNHTLFIAIFSSLETDDDFNRSINYRSIDDCREKFSEADTDTISSIKLAVYHELNDQHIENWLRTNFNEYDVNENKKIVEEIVNKHDVKFEGFKRLRRKIVEQL